MASITNYMIEWTTDNSVDNRETTRQQRQPNSAIIISSLFRIKFAVYIYPW